MLPESSSRPLPATMAQSRNLAHASLETAVCMTSAFFDLFIPPCQDLPLIHKTKSMQPKR